MVWLTNWNYRKAVTITNTESALTDYQVKITITYVAAMQSNFSDIRFTYPNNTNISYWIESKTDGSTATVWIKVNLPNYGTSPTGDNIVYMYYGNPSAISASDGTNTFVFFDDFNNLKGEWKEYGGVGSFDNSIYTEPSGGGNWVYGIKSINRTFGRPFILEWRTNNSDNSFWGVGDTDDNIHYNYIVYAHYSASGTAYVFEDGANRGATGNNPGLYTWVNYKIVVKNTGAVYYIKRPGDGDFLTQYTSTYSTETPLTIVFMHQSTPTVLMDWTFLRQYASPEPTFSISTIEETPANIISTDTTVSHSIPCIEGTCIVTVGVTWTNTGAGSGDFIPNIRIDGSIQTPIYPLQSLAAGASVAKSFTVTGLSIGTHTICPDPN